MTHSQRRACRVLSMSPMQVKAWMDRTKGRIKDDDDLACTLGNIAQRAALYSQYIGERTGSGNCGGKNTHECASGQAQRAVRGVRNALGYTIPKAGLADFNW